MRSRDLRQRGCSRPSACARPFLRTRPPRSRAGLSLVEVVVALSVLVVAASIFCQTLLSTARLRSANRESVLAADAARVVLERMHNQPFLEVFRAFNPDAQDDPGGIGTGPGHLFEVPGLMPLDDAPQGKVGRITFPAMPVQVMAGGGGGKLNAAGGTPTTQWQVREDFEDEGLGTPRDLNGDNVVDTANHATDYLILPLRLTIDWKGSSGARKFEIVTQLGDLRRRDG